MVTTYDCSETLPDAMVAKLVRATTGQWSDGLGAGCFQDLANKYDATIDLAPLDVTDDPNVEISRTPVKSATAVAKGKLFKAAADGDCKKIQEFLDAGADIDEELQSTTPLGMAILCGHVDAAKLLLKAGADPQGPPGEAMLLNAALSNVLTDADAAEIARELIALGADPNGGPAGDEPDMDPLTPLSMAHNREKLLLVRVLKENGAKEA
ncbi:MAG: ankyrin repeat domain-containing protein [Pseudomonadota bacterium]